jgi:hypothetical protein
VTNTSSLVANASWRHRGIFVSSVEKGRVPLFAKATTEYLPTARGAPTRVDLIQLGTAVLYITVISLSCQINSFSSANALKFIYEELVKLNPRRIISLDRKWWQSVGALGAESSRCSIRQKLRLGAKRFANHKVSALINPSRDVNP